LNKGGLYLLRADTLDEARIDALPRAAKVRACKRPEDRKRALAAELLLEAALGREAVSRIRTVPGGKPYIEGGEGDTAPYFSVSHSGVWAALAVSDTEVGVDIEEMRPGRDFRGLAKKAFGPLEDTSAGDTALADTSVADCRSFYRMWTVKESYVKMLGASLAALRSFRVRIIDGEWRVEGDPNTVIHTIEGIEGYMLALALRNGRTN
jgi:4'-phosphopantetheinyl transferase